MDKRTFLLVLLFLVGCRNGNTVVIEPRPDAGCGDGDISSTEDCEGSNLVGASCMSLGFDEGQLTCGNFW